MVEYMTTFYSRVLFLLTLLAALLGQTRTLSSIDEKKEVTIVSSEEYPAYIAYNEGVEFSRRNDHQRAMEAYLTAVRLKPDLCEAHQNMGNLYDKVGDLVSAFESHKLALKYADNRDSSFRASLMANLASSRLKLSLRKAYDPNVIEDVISILKEARSLSPTDEDVLFNLGNAYYAARRYDEANMTFTSLININPNSGLACLNIGNSYFRRRDFEMANEWYNRAIAALSSTDHSNRLTAYTNNGQSLRELGNLSDSLDNFRKALLFTDLKKINELDVWLLNCMIAVMSISTTWKDYEQIEQLVLKNFASTEGLEPESRIDLYTFGLQRYASLAQSLQAAKLACPFFPMELQNQEQEYAREHSSSSSSSSSRNTTIRIGYLSYDWRNHPMGRLTRRLVTTHSRVFFHTTCISYSKDDHSPERMDVRELCQEFVDLYSLNALTMTDALQIIVGLDLDVLIDITSHTYEGRIDFAASHPYGSKQGGVSTSVINYLGYPGTTGCTRFDYNIIDSRALPAEFARYFSEKLVYLPNSYQANSMLYGAEPCLSDTYSGGVSLKLSAHASSCRKRILTPDRRDSSSLLSSFSSPSTIWLCSFNANKKFESNSFHVWMNILRRIPRAVLLLMVPNRVKDTLLSEMRVKGISTARVMFLPMISWSHHLHRVAACDLVLDNFVYGAHTTASDMLWMFVPIVTMEAYGSGRMPSRVAASISHSLFQSKLIDRNSDYNIDKINEEDDDVSKLLVVHSAKEYEDVVVRILSFGGKSDGNSLPFLHYARMSIARRHLLADVFDSQAMQRYIERSYQAILELKYFSTSQWSMRKYHIVVGKDDAYDEGRLLKEALTYLGHILLECTAYLHHVLKGDDGYMETLPAEMMVSLRAITSRLYSLPSASHQFGQEVLELMYSLLAHQPLSEFLGRVCMLYQKIGVDADEISKLRKENPYLLRTLSPESWSSWIATTWPPPSSLDSTVYNTCTYYDFENTFDDENVCKKMDELRNLYDDLPLDIYTKFVARYLHACIEQSGEILALQHIRTAQEEMLRAELRKAENILFKWVSYFFLQETAVPPLTKHDMIDSIHVTGLTVHGGYFYVIPSNTLKAMNNLSNEHENMNIMETLSAIIWLHASLHDSHERHSKTYLLIVSAYALNPSYQLLQAVGVSLQAIDGFEEHGYLIASEAIYHLQLKRYKAYSQHARELNRRRYNPPSTDDTNHEVIRVAFYCFEYGQDWWPHWGPQASQQKGGSEEAAIHLSRAMVAVAQKSHESLLSSSSTAAQQKLFKVDVEMYTDSLEEDLGRDNQGVVWHHYSEFNPEHNPPDVFISWRYPLSMVLGKNSKKRFLWLHDVLQPKDFYHGFRKHVDGIFVQSDFHRETLPTFLHEVTVVLPHGLDSDYALDVPSNDVSDNLHQIKEIEIVNRNQLFIYASAPNRGLEYVLKLWPLIKKSIPGATLEVYYGFGGKVDLMLSNMMGHNAFTSWKEEMLMLLTQEGIDYKGMVSQKDINAAFKKAGFLLYPATWPETGCITVMKAMASGAIPITSRYKNSVLLNLTAHFDMGPHEPLNSSSFEVYGKWLSTWLESVLSAVSTDEQLLIEKRRSMIAYAQRTFSWSRSALRVLEMALG